MNKNFWNEKIILITGGSSGIGYAFIEQILSLSSPKLIINLSRSAPKIKSRNLYHINCDCSKQDRINKAFEKIKKIISQIDILILNAGITVHSKFEDLTISVLKQAFEINFFGSFYLTQLVLPYLEKSKGIILVNSSQSGLYGIPGRSGYSATKMALNGAFEALRIEVLEKDIKVILFLPSYTNTNLRNSGVNGKGNKLLESYSEKKDILSPGLVAERMISCIEKNKSASIIFHFSGFFIKWMRNFSIQLLDRILFKTLYKDFH